MSIIVDVGLRNAQNSAWSRFRDACIYGEIEPDEITDERYLVKRDEALAEWGAVWVPITSGKMFNLKFENEADATAFLLRWA
jgi:hypothetical protein